MQPQPRNFAVMALLFLLFTADADAGTISMAWDPVEHASGYRVYYGTQSGEYEHFVDVGNATDAALSGLDDCRTYFISVKAYNSFGESNQYSTEITGWSRPVFVQQATVALQGNQLVLEVQGANFDELAELVIDIGALPIGEDGTPLVTFDSVDVISCDRIQALVTVEPSARGFQPTPTGVLPVGLQLRNPDGVSNSGSIQLDVQFNPDRADVNRLYQRTVDRVDGDDLASLARAWASQVGQDSFEFDCDMDGDTDIDGDDLALLATVFGQCRSGSTWSAEACL